MEKPGCSPLDRREVSRVAQMGAGPWLPGYKGIHLACRLQKGLRDGKSALGRAIHSLECTVRVLVTRTVVDAVRGADRLRLVSSWAQRVGMFLCQQGGMAAGPCGVHPRRGRETIAGLGQRLWACRVTAHAWCEAAARRPCKSTHARGPRGARRKRQNQEDSLPP